MGQQLKDVETLDLDKVDLNDILNAFYANARKSDGTMYKKNSLVGHRHGIARYFKEKYQINIIDDKTYQQANTTFQSALVELKKSRSCSC